MPALIQRPRARKHKQSLAQPQGKECFFKNFFSKKKQTKIQKFYNQEQSL